MAPCPLRMPDWGICSKVHTLALPFMANHSVYLRQSMSSQNKVKGRNWNSPYNLPSQNANLVHHCSFQQHSSHAVAQACPNRPSSNHAQGMRTTVHNDLLTMSPACRKFVADYLYIYFHNHHCHPTLVLSCTVTDRPPPGQAPSLQQWRGHLF